MLLDNARTSFAVSPRLPLGWLYHHVDPTARIDDQKTEAEEATKLLHSRIVLPAAGLPFAR
jgi:hypothetical protein